MTRNPLTDDAVAAALRRLEKPQTPRPEFAEDLYKLVRVELLPRRRVNLRLLAAAALLLVTGAATAAVGSQMLKPNTDRTAVQTSAPTPPATPTAQAESPTRDPAALGSMVDAIALFTSHGFAGQIGNSGESWFGYQPNASVLVVGNPDVRRIALVAYPGSSDVGVIEIVLDAYAPAAESFVKDQLTSGTAGSTTRVFDQDLSVTVETTAGVDLSAVVTIERGGPIESSGATDSPRAE